MWLIISVSNIHFVDVTDPEESVSKQLEHLD